jgi:hypothetical protein
MIALLLAAGLTGAPLDASMAQARRQYGACLSRFMKTQETKKMDAAAYKAAAATACAAPTDAFRRAWIAYDVSMKTSPSEAAQDAASQIQEYLDNSTQNYEDSFAPAPAPHG